MSAAAPPPPPPPPPPAASAAADEPGMPEQQRPSAPTAPTAAAAAEPGMPEQRPSAADLSLHLPPSTVVTSAAPPQPGSPQHLLSRAHSSRTYCGAAALRRPGTELWAFGRNDLGQLGLGSTDDAAAPQLVAALQGRDLVGAAAGTTHSALVTADGDVYVCGDNSSSQLGVRQREPALLPTRVGGLDNQPARVESVVCGSSHTLAVMQDGTVAAWGSNQWGEAGLGASGTQASATQRMRVDVPRVVKDLRSQHAERVAAGDGITLTLSATGGVFSCGASTQGQQGRDASKAAGPRPISRLWPLGVVQVACGGAHCAALLEDGRLLTWGRGRFGALGLLDTENRSTPQVVRSLAGVRGRQVSCGEDHTCLLDQEGGLYTWGRGTWGQTGHGHCENQTMPQRVAALAGRRVVQVAAGGRHTLALDASNQLWGCGNNESGQLGAPPCASQPTPQPVCGLPAASPVLFVAAGGDHSLAVVDRHASLADTAVGPCATRPHGEQWRAVQLPNLLQLAAEAAAHKGDTASRDAVIAAVEQVFSSPGYLLAALREQQQGQTAAAAAAAAGAAAIQGDAAEAMETSPGRPAPADVEQQQAAAVQQPAAQQEGLLDVQAAGSLFSALLTLYDADVVAALGNTCLRLLDMLERFLNSLLQQQEFAAAAAAGSQQAAAGRQRQDLAWMAPLLCVLLQSPLNGEPSIGGKLLTRICRIVAVTLPAQERLPVRRAAQAMLSRLPADVLAARCVRPVLRFIEGCVQTGLGATRVLMAGVLADILRQASEDGGGILALAEFNSRALSEHADLQLEYVLWRQNKDPTALCSLCQMPYLLTPEAKARIMAGEAAMEQQQHLSAASLQAMFQGVPPSSIAFLHIQVRRTHVVQDALNQLVYRGAEELKKPLRATFISGGVPEPAQDAGGVTKELFMLLVRDLFQPDYGMFVRDDQTRTYWFNAASLEAEIEFALVGAILGLAIYNQTILDVHFPLVVYKKLLGQQGTFQDLKAAFPQLGRGLQQLLDWEGDVEGVFCRTFVAEWDYWGEVRAEELKPGGAAIPVTAANREEYVRLYTEWVLDRSVASQFRAFRAGFLRAAAGPALGLFTPAELELLICGLPHLDFEALQRVARYEGGYSRDTPVVRWLWDSVRGLSLESKRAFLQFTTGCDRAPVGGLGKLPLVIQRAGPDTDRLPTSHTCFNSLLLPEYSSEAKLGEKLLTAIRNAQGFGLE